MTEQAPAAGQASGSSQTPAAGQGTVAAQAEVDGRTWESMTQELAVRLTRLADHDTVILSAGGYYVQVQQLPEHLVVEAASSHYLEPDEALTPEQEFRLRTIGWFVPDAWHSSNFWIRGYWPLAGREALRIAGMMTTSLRDVYGAGSPAEVDDKSFNADTGPPDEDDD
jgi:hypothetical protein